VKAQPGFSTGDWIVHTHYGIGQVITREGKIFEGEEKEYLRIKTGDSEYWLQVDNMDVDYIRPLASLSQIKNALTLIKTQPDVLAGDYKIRRKEIGVALNDVALEAKACLIRDLTERKRVKSLNITEGEVLEQLKTDFLTEWSLVSGEEKRALEEKLASALKSRSAKYLSA
jgi:RNA polymerase-interacting CarD/CdnL/TRCF family regulator